MLRTSSIHAQSAVSHSIKYALMAFVATWGLILSSCTLPGLGGVTYNSDTMPDLSGDIAKNTGITVDDRFPSTPTVFDGTNGIDTSALFFEQSDSAVVTDSNFEHMLRGASIAVASGAPMLVHNNDKQKPVEKELDRLNVATVLTIGDVALDVPKDDTGDKSRPDQKKYKVLQDDGTEAGLDRLTAQRFQTQKIDGHDSAVKSIVDLPETDPLVLTSSDDSSSQQGDSDDSGNDDLNTPSSSSDADDDSQSEGLTDTTGAFPAQGSRDGGMSPVVLTVSSSPIAEVATAKAYGAHIVHLPAPDPRINLDGMQATAGLENGPVLALGSDFGLNARLSSAIRLVSQTKQQLPGSGITFSQEKKVYAVTVNPNSYFDDNSLRANVSAAQEGAENYDAVPALMIPISRFVQTDTGTALESNNFNDVSAIAAQMIQAGGIVILSMATEDSGYVWQLEDYQDLLRSPSVHISMNAEYMGDGVQPIVPDEDSMKKLWKQLADIVDNTQGPQKAVYVENADLLDPKVRLRADVAEVDMILLPERSSELILT